MASVWREPIFDRTQADVAFAIQKIAEWTAYNISAAEYDEKVRIENEKLILREGYATTINDKLVLQGDGRAYVEDTAMIVRVGVVYDLKGCLNLSDITRIEDNISYLANCLKAYPRPNMVHSKEWTKNGLPTALDMARIGANIRSLFAGFYTPSGATAVPDVMLSYEDINALERNLYLLKQLLDAMESSFIKSGTYKCGATSRLPIRR